MKTKLKIVMIASVCSSTVATVTLAQTEQLQARVLEEVMVTATLRESSVQDIPLAVTAISPVALERQGVVDIKQLKSLSPSFSVYTTSTETGGSGITLRGVGTVGNNPGLESSVGVFIDGVYQSRPAIAFGELVDIERLEVLRGPQGTLFGRNTSAGAISIITKKPSLTEFEGFANMSYGNYDLTNVQAGAGGPITDDVGWRVAGSWRERDGVAESATTGATTGDRDRWITRGQLYAEPSENLSIRLLTDYSDIDERCCDAVIGRESTLVTPDRATINGLPDTGVVAVGSSALEDLKTNGGQFFNGAEQWGISGELNYDLNDARLTYIGSYRDYESFQTSETSLVDLRIFTQGNGGVSRTPGQPDMGDRIKTITQELRLQGNAFDDKLDWLIGAYYSDEDLTNIQTATLGADFQGALSAFGLPVPYGPGGFPANPLLFVTGFGNGGIPVNAAGGNAANRFTQDGESQSIFTHNVYDLSDELSVTLGVRYVDERKKGGLNQLQGSNAACEAAANAAVNRLFPSPLFSPIALANCFAIATPVNLPGPGGTGLASDFVPIVREYDAVFEDDALTYTTQLAYRPDTDLMFYGSFTHGFKSGGMNLDATAATLLNSAEVLATGAAPRYADPRVRSEDVDAYELGMKSTFGWIKANVALFYMDFTDFQLLDFDGVRFRTFNVPKAESEGVEVEVFGELTENVSANLAVTYADTFFPNDCADGAPADEYAAVVDFCGEPLPRSPKYSGVAGLTYEGQLVDSGWDFLANMNLQYSDSYRSSTRPFDSDAAESPLPFVEQDSFYKLNARLGLTTPDGRFTFEVWGLNLTDEINRTLTGNVPGRGVGGNRSMAVFFDEPRTYGLTVRTVF